MTIVLEISAQDRVAGIYRVEYVGFLLVLSGEDLGQPWKLPRSRSDEDK